mmetsp:Transcript_97436/g.223334  ORF Transcript_97436/g.223334 Transcript_97436/m.223334 type:complete len:207 (+) Transcript_97436:3351-3971(+)
MGGLLRFCKDIGHGRTQILQGTHALPFFRVWLIKPRHFASFQRPRAILRQLGKKRLDKCDNFVTTITKLIPVWLCLTNLLHHVHVIHSLERPTRSQTLIRHDTHRPNIAFEAECCWAIPDLRSNVRRRALDSALIRSTSPLSDGSRVREFRQAKVSNSNYWRPTRITWLSQQKIRRFDVTMHDVFTMNEPESTKTLLDSVLDPMAF